MSQTEHIISVIYVCQPYPLRCCSYWFIVMHVANFRMSGDLSGPGYLATLASVVIGSACQGP